MLAPHHLPCIVGPDTLVSTVDGPGLSVPFKIERLAKRKGGITTFQWTVPLRGLIMIDGPNDARTVMVHALQNCESANVGDQILSCDYTQVGETKSVDFPITVARPSALTPIGTPVTTMTSTYVNTVFNYQLMDQFGRNLQEVYTYIDSKSRQHQVRVINLLVGEQLTPIGLPSTITPPAEAWNLGVSNNGTFTDTIGSPRGVTFTSHQIIKVHQNSWIQGNSGIGDPVGYRLITHHGESQTVADDDFTE